MSWFVLRPCANTSYVADILLPAGKTVIGRGQFLRITDKRVSRSHAVLEINDGKLRMLPTHVNPTFYQKVGTEKLKPLTKDEWQELQNGDKFSLIPDFHIFKVVIGEKPLNNSSGSKAEASETASTQQEANGKEICNKKANHSGSDVESKDEASKPEPSVSTEKGKVQTVKLPGKKEVALPVQRERKLPSWILNAKPPSTSNTSSFEPRVVAASQIASKGTGGVKRKASDDNSFEESLPKKPGRGRPKKPHVVSISEDEYSSGEVIPKATGRRALDDDLDLDWMISDDNDNDNDDDVSDWEEDRKGKKKTPKKKGGRRRSSSSVAEKKTPPRRSASRRSYAEMSDSDDEIYEEDLLPARPMSGRKKKQVINDNDDDDDDKGDKKTCPYGKNCYRKNPGHFEEFSHLEDADVGASQSIEEEDNSLPECPYGTECYRKNKVHLQEYKHTTNPSADRPRRKATDKKSVLDGASDDESQPNTYDYDDSFIDDQRMTLADEEDSSSYGEEDKDSDWEPASLEKDQVKELVKEARGFIKNKKMAKKV